MNELTFSGKLIKFFPVDAVIIAHNNLLGIGATAAHLTLDQAIGVRIPDSQPITFKMTEETTPCLV